MAVSVNCLIIKNLHPMCRKLLLLSGIFLVSQSCTYNILFLERNIWQEFEGIYVIEEPDNLELYAQLLPEQFNMPAIPMVGLFTVDYVDTEQWPITLTKYLKPYKESAVFITCTYEGQEGWYCPYMAVTTEAALIGGHRLGYPKILADSVIFEKRSDGWYGATYVMDQVEIGMDFVLDPDIGLSGYHKMQKEFVKGSPVSDFTFTTMLLKPPAVGPELAIFSLSPPPLVSRSPGWVTIDLGGALSGLIESGKVSPALYQYHEVETARQPSGPVFILGILLLILAAGTVVLIRILRRSKRA